MTLSWDKNANIFFPFATKKRQLKRAWKAGLKNKNLPLIRSTKVGAFVYEYVEA